METTMKTALPISQVMNTTLRSLPFSQDPFTLDENAVLSRANDFIKSTETYTTSFRLVISSLYAIGAHDKVTEVLAAVEARDDELQKSRRELFAEYGLSNEISAHELHRLESAEKELSYCKECDGSQCKRPAFKWFDYEIKVIDGHPKLIQYPCCKKFTKFRQKQKIKQLFADSHIPSEFRHISFADYIVNDGNRVAFERAKQVIDDGVDGIMGLYIYGDTGVGKTMLASIIANEAVKQGRSVIFAALPDLLDDIKTTFESKTGQVTEHNFGDNFKITEFKSSYSETLKAIKTVDLLVLDDMGTESNSIWVAETITKILNSRKSSELPTIITSNLNHIQLEKHYSYSRKDRDVNAQADLKKAAGRIISRIYAMCDAAKIVGNDWRKN